ncbi:hypothetical protein CPC16_011099 [Podila verticillata]|nr:hypothetical protein BGZ52_001937 [Haplosporangium bisporale]KAF9394489.1 hypothetical protein CPC16_011099 [Podila verticillata]KFH71663.1 hypothetical protein MVEG_01959 [Podila verticillata NRRL 6337]
MKIPTAIISLSALFMASMVSAMPDDPAKIDTCIKPGTVALTFDDGPGIYNTQLLAILAKKNVKATFFLIGENIVQTPALSATLKNMLAGGHQLASHTYTHSNLDLMTEDQMKKEIQQTSDAMFTHSGVRPAYMRAPEGRCSELCTKVMTELGLVISHWNVDTNDWRHKAEAPQTAADLSMVEINDVIIKNSNPATDSFILLQHEIHKFSVELLADRVIDSILAKGYKFVTMEECVGKPSYLTGSVVPPVDPSATSSATPTTSSTVAPGVSGTTSARAGASATISPATGNKGANGAGALQMGAWAMGLAAAVGFSLF